MEGRTRKKKPLSRLAKAFLSYALIAALALPPQAAWAEITEGTTSGEGALAIGEGSIAYDYSTSIGINAVAGDSVPIQYSYYYASAFGYEAKATGWYSSAFGWGAEAITDNASAFGVKAEATGKYSSAVGSNAKATEYGSSAFGYGSDALEKSSAFGMMAEGGYRELQFCVRSLCPCRKGL